MIKKAVTSVCIVCLALGGCAEDNPLPNSGTSLSMEPATMKLALGIDDYNALSTRRTHMEEMPPMLSMSFPNMNVELIATPSVTGVIPSAVTTEDNAVYSYMGFQFDGTKSDEKLVEKKFFTSPDGSIRTDEVEIIPIPAGQKNMVVILTNVDENEFVTMTVGGSTYRNLQQFCMVLATDDGTFPRSKVALPNDDGKETGIVMCGRAAAEVNAGKQLYISLRHTVAGIALNIEATYQHFIDMEHT